jgi:hypothetical protein
MATDGTAARNPVPMGFSPFSASSRVQYEKKTLLRTYYALAKLKLIS